MHMKERVISREGSASGRLFSKALGKSKASKFALVEGLSLNQQSATFAARMERRGLKGDALRAAIASEFSTERG